MNLGDRIKQLRAEKNLTQPQLAEAVGIEQSYLSKLENDKSNPSPDIFNALLKGLDVNVETFLKNLDEQTVIASLKHIPEVALHLNSRISARVHHIKKWLFNSAIACVVGLTCIVAGHQSLIFSAEIFEYHSGGVLKKGERYPTFENIESEIQSAGCTHSFNINGERMEPERCTQLRNSLLSRQDDQTVLSPEYRGKMYLVETENGIRAYFNYGSKKGSDKPNKWLELLGFFLLFSGALGFFVEYRLRKI